MYQISKFYPQNQTGKHDIENLPLAARHSLRFPRLRASGRVRQNFRFGQRAAADHGRVPKAAVQG